MEQVKELSKDSDVVGVSAMSYSAPLAMQVIEHLKPLGKPTIWGGHFPTSQPERCIELTDVICIGEGEGAMLDFVEAVEQGRDYADIPNLWIRHNGKIIQNPLRPLIQDLDSLPLADYDLETQHMLLGAKRRGGAAFQDDEEIVPAKEYDWSRDEFGETLMIHSTRGCPHRCSYCHNCSLWDMYKGKGKYIRSMSPPRMIEQIKAIRAVLPQWTNIWFTDDTFFVRHTQEIREFRDIYKSEVGLPFDMYGSPPTVREDKLALLVDAGANKIRMGIQSGSEYINYEVYNRKIPNEKVLQAGNIINKFKDKLMPTYQLIITNPYEQKQDVMDSIKMIEQLPPPYHLGIFNLVFFPGNQLYEKAVRDGIIKGDDDSGVGLNFHTNNQSEHFRIKKANRYLNTILYHCHGGVTERKIGIIPRFLFPLLTSRCVIWLGDRMEFLVNPTNKILDGMRAVISNIVHAKNRRLLET